MVKIKEKTIRDVLVWYGIKSGDILEAELGHKLAVTADMDCFCGSDNCEVCSECDYENHD